MSTSSNMIGAWLSKAKKPLIVVLGPTASGKTDFSVQLAKEMGNVEIVNADSRQIYTHLDIGTAKITKEEMQDVPHHLFSVLDPKEKLNVAWYKEEANRIIHDIHARGKIPMLVGGSMLYISAVIDDFDLVEQPSPELRKKLEDEYEKDGGQTLFTRLQSVDPESAMNFSKENKRYVVRALEMYEATGKPKSQILKNESPYDLFLIGMDVPREVLHERIAVRAEKMIAGGWMEEVKALLEKGYSEHDPGMESHGYREIIQFLKGEMSQEEAKKRIIEQTRQYVKRQMTWWRKDERIRWVTP